LQDPLFQIILNKLAGFGFYYDTNQETDCQDDRNNQNIGNNFLELALGDHKICQWLNDIRDPVVQPSEDEGENNRWQDNRQTTYDRGFYECF
jgi:hypothetical protein